ncbi:CLUMA_CG009214, isoform A [Clunio marinus]|uniref:CLUMA_CG009214, isoform A n=1 Tax=Clunio marinus TaxID=568069 RepID=A0A1J1I634_9DIPT|nr:CLUMA_CG009214, isoform A [Clunio marinus]
MDENGKAEVSLPSATRTEAPVATQQENLICEVEKLEEKKDDNIVADKNTEVIDIKSEASESDNEDVIASQNEPGKNSDVNIDDEFEKVVPLKFKKLSEESTDEIDHEIEQILQEAKPLEIELPLEIAAEQSKDSENIKTSGETGLVDEKETDQQISSDIKPFSDSNKSFEIASFQPESQQKSEFAENIFKPKITQASIEIEIKPQVSTKPIELISNTENIEVKPQDLKVSITEIQEKPLHIENNESSTPGDLSNDKISEALSSEALVSEDEQKPPVPIPTYLWEDVKKSKEQGGYPWTHLYKQPLGDNEEPEIILNYKHSPRSSRKHFDSESGTPKSQKKVRIQDEIEVKETENYIQDLSDQEAEGGEKAINKDDAEPSETFEDNEKILDEQKSPKSILKGSKNIAENIKPKESKFDSGSLKKKIKNPLQKIKKMADQQFKKVKSSKPSIKKIPVSKNDLALNDELKILKLKESPKSQHREITSYVVKQDSEDSLEILELDESPMENRKRKKAENVMVKPDEIIDLPLSDDSKENISQTNEQKEQSDNEQRESTVESHEISISGSSSHSKDGTSKKRDHVYEDIEEYISRITSDKENVERVAFEHDEKLERKPQPGEIDPVFDEFSRELNKRIRRSLSVHDEKTRQDFAEEIPQIKMLETHLSSQENQDDNDKKISKKNKKMKKQKSTEHEDEENSTTLSAVETKIENLISKITSDNEHVERASFEEDPRLEPKPGEIDPVFDEFSRELNKRIRRSLSVHDEKLRQEISEEITHAKELDETSIEKNLSKVTSEGVTEEHEIPGNDSMSNRKIDPIFDEFSKDINNSIRKSLTTQDEKYRQELAKKIPRIEELEKQISDEDKEEKIEEISDVHIKHLHLLAPISSIDSTSSDEDRKTQLSILAEESETSDNKKKSFDDSSVDREIESLKNDGSDISTTLIEDVNKIKDESKETNLSIEENKNNDKTLKQSPSKPQDDSCQIVKEDVFVKLPQESSKKINSRWSKMRAESSHAAPLEVRCACQFYQTDSLIPERINPIGSRPPSRAGEIEKPIYCSKHNNLESTAEEEKLSGSVLSFGKSSVPDYYADTNNSIQSEEYRYSNNKENESLRQINQSITFDGKNVPSIEIENYRRDFPTTGSSFATTSIVQSNVTSPYTMKKGQFSSQKSLDRYSTSTLLNKYRPKSKSQAPSLQGSSADIRTSTKMTKTVSFDYGKSSNVNSNDNPNFDQYHRMSPMVFPIRDRMQKLERMHDSRDHEYEPISDPNENVTDLDQPDTQNSDKKLLRTPTEDSEDNISAQDFQNEIENRFFKQEIAPIVDDETHVHQENTFEEAVIIDEGPVTRELPKKRNIITSAQEQGKNLHKKIKAQAGMLKSSLGSKMKRKPKEKPVAAEVAKEDEEMTADVEMFTESEVVETVTVQPKPQSKSKTFKMPNFAKNIKKPSLPKFKKSQSNKPDEISSSEVPSERPSLPELKIGERFARFRKLGRSKSLKEESATNDSESFTTPEIATAEPTKKRFHFGTYPRMIRDKFKKQKLPERSDQSVRSESPPIVEFKRVTETFTQRGPVASRWPEYHQDSEKYQQFHSESEIDRESSIERRMRLDYDRSTEEREDFEIVKRLLSEEQKQLDDMENENHEIHLMAQERYKKSAVERQSSDDDKMLWSGMLNKDVTDEFHEPNALKFDDSEKYALDYYKNESDLNRSYTPQTNQETQSSGSSETRRRKGILDEEDDYFLRENRISNEIHIGDYISSAIKEGLSSPEDNALSKMGKYDEKKSDFIPDKPIRSLKRKNKKNQEDDGEDDNKWNRENTLGFKEFYKTFPEAQQGRHQTKSFSTEGDAEEDIDLNRDELVGDSFDVGDEIIDDLSEQDSYYRQQILKGLEHPDLILAKDDFDNDLEYNLSNLPVPPTPPRRRKKKKIRAFQPFVAVRNESITDKTPLAEQNITVFQSQQKYVPLAQEEYFTTPTPTPRRTRSRSEISAHTLDDAESFKKDSVEGFTAFHNQDKENGYALVRKETPSRPVRRKRSTKSLGERQFATMPHMKRDGDTPPHRPVRNYSTIIPSKPPRTKSTGSLVEISKTIKNDDDDYEEILDNNDNSIVHQRLKSGEIVKKMKDRPLPPPPRPKRENKKNKKDDGNNDDNKFDKDDGAEKVIESLTIETDTENVFLENIHDVHESEPFASASLPRQDSDLSEPDKVIEVEVSTQTDPVPDEEFICDDDEDENIDIDLGDEFLTSNGKMKTLEDILKEEQEAEIERARQLAEAENLSRGIQRFRDSSQRSLSERSKASGDRSRSLSRPITPSAVLVEQKKSSPIMFNNEEQTLTEAGLFIHPITYDDFGRPPSEEESNLIEQTTEALDVNNNFELVNIINEPTIQQNEPTNITLNIIPQDDLNLDSEQTPNDQEDVAGDKEKDDEYFDRDMQRKIEEMIESVMNSARDEVDLIKTSNDNVVEEVKDEIEALQAPPLPPPRRKSNIETAEKTNEIKESSRVDGTQNDSKMLSPHENQTHQEEFSALEQVQSDFHGNQLSNRLHLPNLEIDNLSVHSLQAGRIVASEIDSNTIVTNELECKSSHNITSDDKPIEFPPGFIEEIVERVRNAERVEQHKQHDPSQQPQRVADDENAPVRPPLPTEFNYIAVPPAFYQLRDNSEEDAVHHQSVPQRRRRHQNRKRDSTSEEDYQKGQRTKSRGGTSSDQSVLGAGSQFIRACGNALKESGGQLMEILRASSKDENKRDLHLALVILIIIVAGLILMGMGDKSVHHHHWDFFNPPDNHGR